MEVTKPRRNAATVTAAERAAYINAVLAIDTGALFRFSDGVPYWKKQNVIHSVGGALHGVQGFLPWHREMLNRLEVLLRESDPLLTLLYWDWTTDPRGGVNLFSTSFMGQSNGTVAVPLRPPTLTRDVGFSFFAPESDGTIVGRAVYPAFRLGLELTPNHNSAHGFIGGPSGRISSLSTAAQDPFFFLLHGNVDRLWAHWQRDPGRPERVDPDTATGTAATDPTITGTMSPWDGGTGIALWTNPAEQYSKPANHASVVAAPIYDTAPLRVPVLQPGQAVVLQIPWFPPDPSRYGCFGDPGHFCLLARIETTAAAPFGMTFPEGTNVDTNTRNNNNIAWKNVTVVDDVPRLRFLSGVLVRNFLRTPARFRLVVRVPQDQRERSIFRHGAVELVVPEALEEGWRKTGGIAQGIRAGDRGDGTRTLEVAEDGSFLEVELGPGEDHALNLGFRLDPDVPAEVRREPFLLDLEQVLVADGAFEPTTRVGGSGSRSTPRSSPSSRGTRSGPSWPTAPTPAAAGPSRTSTPRSGRRSALRWSSVPPRRRADTGAATARRPGRRLPPTPGRPSTSTTRRSTAICGSASGRATERRSTSTAPRSRAGTSPKARSPARPRRPRRSRGWRPASTRNWSRPSRCR